MALFFVISIALATAGLPYALVDLSAHCEYFLVQYGEFGICTLLVVNVICHRLFSAVAFWLAGFIAPVDCDSRIDFTGAAA